MVIMNVGKYDNISMRNKLVEFAFSNWIMTELIFDCLI